MRGGRLAGQMTGAAWKRLPSPAGAAKEGP